MPIPPIPMAGGARPPTPPMPAPRLPGTPAGGPGGPGGTPMLSPGGGAGNEEKAKATIAHAMDVLKQALVAFPAQSKEFQVISRAITSLNPLFGSGKGVDLKSAGGRQLTEAPSPGPLAGAPPPGIVSPPPQMPVPPPPGELGGP